VVPPLSTGDFPCEGLRARIHRVALLVKMREGMTFGTDGYVLAEGKGQGLWFVNGLFTVKAGGSETRDAFTLIEAHLPNDLQVPLPHPRARGRRFLRPRACAMRQSCETKT
jgi:hypothetical protein